MPRADDYQAAIAARLTDLRTAARQDLRDQRRRHWEQVRAAAERQVIQDQRAAVLLGQVERWERVQKIDAFLLAAGQDLHAPDWLNWIGAYRNQIDPLKQPMTMPDVDAITHQALTPFMQGLDPAGPEPQPLKWR